ncbi:hypothetical protein DFJ67_0398 [Asanoa ferruginea]|uniref:Uncharacterized protein n=1 Tax=Asanoa ferruginea TaxID=53367 RepID=A0A3D9ZLD2_9ACTN|nr:hypothetical protein [Asanoa ferruginea]REF94460.1 hypothetical protein DFJ67_0398 [Asanoa ferruginea]GIF52205.1 hypothetical protein Afe04nite_67440 [Asanoa ferruginea]
MGRSSWAVATALPLLMLASACAQPAADAAPAAPPPAAEALGADEVALRVTHAGGFVTPQSIPSRVPALSIYGDGRVISEGPVAAIYPGPALPNLQQSRISTADVDALVRRAVKAGVGAGTDLGQPGVADAATTRFVVTTEAGLRRTDAYALEMPDDGGLLTADQKAARKKLSDLLADLQDLPKTLGSGAVTEEGGYQAKVVAGIATPYTQQPENVAELAPPTAVVWPGPVLPGGRLNPNVDVGCVAASGDQARAVLTAAGKANAMTPWTSAGKRWSVLLRPLLPDESGCADLAKQE